MVLKVVEAQVAAFLSKLRECKLYYYYLIWIVYFHAVVSYFLAYICFLLLIADSQAMELSEISGCICACC